MSAIDLSTPEKEALITALESYLSELATERVGTDNRVLHRELKEQEAILGGILKRLTAITS